MTDPTESLDTVPVMGRPRGRPRVERLGEAVATSPKQPCIGKDPLCPCQDGDMCHYKGKDAFPIPTQTPVNCMFDPGDDDSGYATIYISAEYLRRLRTKATHKPLSDQLWFDIIRPALEGYCF